MDLIETVTTLDIYYQEQLLISHPYAPIILPKDLQPIERKIGQSGQISYKGHKYNLDYKYKGKTVNVISDASTKTLRIFFNGIMIKEMPIIEKFPKSSFFYE